jgi:hypothetical protein
MGGKHKDGNESRPWLPPARGKSPWPQLPFRVLRLQLTPGGFTSMLRSAHHCSDLGISGGNFAASGRPWDRRRHGVDGGPKQLAWGPSAKREWVREGILRRGDEWEWEVRPPLRSHAATASTVWIGGLEGGPRKRGRESGRFGKSGWLKSSSSNWPLSAE